jgi:ABC-type proline/glycine betaine transport system permease subunit
MASLTVALIVAALGLLGLGYGVYEMMTHAGPDAALKTAGGLAVYVIVCLALARLSW